jgi:hypothetical protein
LRWLGYRDVMCRPRGPFASYYKPVIRVSNRSLDNLKS